MKTIFILLVCCYLSACELMGLHRCDALSGWCVPSKWTPDAYMLWSSKEELAHLLNEPTLDRLKNRNAIIERKKKILADCNIDSTNGNILNNWTEDRAYHCVYKKGLCTSRNGKYKCDF